MKGKTRDAQKPYRHRPLPQIWALRYDGSRSAAVEPGPVQAGFTFEARAVTDPETFCAYELVWRP
jgi:hypothetical protein